MFKRFFIVFFCFMGTVCLAEKSCNDVISSIQIQKMIQELPEQERELLKVSSLSPEQLKFLEDYIFIGIPVSILICLLCFCIGAILDGKLSPCVEKIVDKIKRSIQNRRIRQQDVIIEFDSRV